jgi:hypothetical protein
VGGNGDPVVTRADLPPPRPSEVLRRFEGYLTDSKCGLKGGQPDHGRCLEICLREGHKPMFVMGGQLYRLDGLDRIGGDPDRAVSFFGYLDLRTSTIRVAGAR